MLRGLEIEQKSYNFILRNLCSGGRTCRHVLLPHCVSLTLWQVAQPGNQAVVVAWKPTGVLVNEALQGQEIPLGTSSLVFPVNFCKHCSHVHMSCLAITWGLQGILTICFPPSKGFVSLAPGWLYFWFPGCPPALSIVVKWSCALVWEPGSCVTLGRLLSLGREVRLSAAVCYLC